MHTPDADAHGIFAASLVRALAQILIGRGTVDKAEMLAVCATARKQLSDSGVRNDRAAETDAALLVASFSEDIGRYF